MHYIYFILFFIVAFADVSHAITYYDTGTPTLTDIWVDPVSGNDSNSGASTAAALKTITRAWRLVPIGTVLSITGYRINLLPGNYPCEPGPEADNCINYFSDIKGTFQFPVIIRAYYGPGSVIIRGGLNINNVSYLYLIALNMAGGTPLPTNSSGNNLLHLAGSDHVLLKGLTLAGPSCDNDTCNNLQEVLKVNQTQYLYVEDCTIGGAWHSSVDYMVVQYGHFLNNRLHTAGQWCMYLKGGSSYLRIEGNELNGCQLGFEAGQSANFAMMQSPWLHYDAYDIKFVNNILHDIPGIGMSVAGGYNVLFAYNTLYKVGISLTVGYGLMDFIHGERNCTATDELPNPVPRCASFIAAGGWGPDFLTDSQAAVPNHKVYVYNNIFYNPTPTQTLYSHLNVYGPLTPPEGFKNFPTPSKADDNLVVRGNMIWNGLPDHPLGIEDSSRGCRDTNPTCNATQLKADNSINTVEPQFVDPVGGNFHPASGGNVFSAVSYAIPEFTWSDAPVLPYVPQGALNNTISVDRDNNSRTSPGPPGAYAQAVTRTAVVVSNSIGSRNTIKISDMSGTLPVSGDAITVSAWDANGNTLPESGGAVPLNLYSHGTTSISGSVLAARFPSGTPTLYKFAINSSKVVITNVKNSTNDAFKVPIVYLNGVTNFVSNSIGNYNTIKASDMSGTLPASGSPISVKAWDANGSALTESGSAVPLVLYSHGTTSISGSTLAARFLTGVPMVYEFTVQSAKVLITNVKSSTDGKLNVPVAYTSGVSNFVSNSIGSNNTLEISDLSGILPSGVGPISVKAWDVNGNELSESGSTAPLTLHNHGTTTISGLNLIARFPAGKPMTYEFSIESSKVLITNVKSSTDGLVEIPSIFTSGISNYATNYVGSLNTIKISDMSGALPAGGVAISITAWDTNGNVVLESGGAVPLKLQNLGTTIIYGSDLAARFPSGSPRMYEFSIGSSNAIVTSLTTSIDGTIKTPTVFTIGGYGGV